MMMIVFLELLVDIVDDFNGGFAGGGVQVGQGFIKEQDIHIVDHDPGQRGALLLAAGELERRGGQQAVHIHHSGHLPDTFMHHGGWDIIIFQGKSDIFASGQPDELPVGILQARYRRFWKA